MDISQLNEWFSYQQQQPIIEQLSGRVGLTRTRAEYFLRLWVTTQAEILGVEDWR